MKRASKISKPASQSPGQAQLKLYTGIHRFEANADSRGDLAQWVVGLTLGGRVDYRLGSRVEVLDKDDVILIRPRIKQFWNVPAVGAARPLGARDSGPNPGFWHVIYAAFMAPVEWHAWMDLPVEDKGYFRTNLGADPAMRRRVYRALFKAHRLSLSRLPVHDQLAHHAVGEALLWLSAGLAKQAAPMDSRIARAVEFVSLRLDRAIMLEEIADAAMTSRSQLSLLFQQRLNISPMQYVELQRIERAKEMLRMTAHPIKFIATMVGYEDPRYFIKRFRGRVGITPRRFRDGASGKV